MSIIFMLILLLLGILGSPLWEAVALLLLLSVFRSPAEGKLTPRPGNPQLKGVWQVYLTIS